VWDVLRGKGIEYTHDHLVEHVEANKGAVSTANDHKNFKKQFDEWLEVTGRWNEAGSLMGKIKNRRERERVVGFYILDEYRYRGKREEQILVTVSRGKSTFERYLECSKAWKSPMAKAVATSCPRTKVEVEDKLRGQLEREKYDINFGIMYKIREWSKVETMRWNEHPGRERVGRAVIYLLACMMFDIGMRKSNICEGRAPDGTKEQGDRGDEEEVDSDGEERRHEESHCQEIGHWEFLVDDPSRKDEWIGGGPEMVKYLERQPNETVTLARSRYVTSKASRNGRGKELPKQTAAVGRRTELEAEFLDLLLDYLRWNQPTSKKQHIFLRRKFSPEEMANSDRKTGINKAKSIRCDDLISQLKKLTREAGIRDSHASASSFRKGNVSTGVWLGEKRAADREEELKRIRLRGGKWVAKSKTTEAHYLNVKDNRGPLAMVSTWEEALSKDRGFEDWKHRQGAANSPRQKET
jgi:hypothetical protein